MTWLLRFYQSNIGLKVVMALTGAGLFGFVFFHMLGNLQVFWGERILDEYAAFLHDHPTVLWLARGGLLTMVLAHIHAAFTLTNRSRLARPKGYKNFQRSNRAELGMRLSSIIVLGFIIFHLLHFTTGTFHHDYTHGEVYHNVVSAFKLAPIAIFYMLANALLGLHLYHGLWSMFRTLGVSTPRYDGLARNFARVSALTIVAGNVLMPLAGLIGLLPAA
ncbi:MAG: succinate dehydrogenase cytochrome b subunit [Myxococcota bacterium]